MTLTYPLVSVFLLIGNTPEMHTEGMMKTKYSDS